MTEAEKIAAGLTKAQRQWLPAFTKEPLGMFPVGMPRATRRKLAEMGLITMERPFAFGMVKSRLTPLGLQVRVILQDRFPTSATTDTPSKS
jgi:hypothetical protein